MLDNTESYTSHENMEHNRIDTQVEMFRRERIRLKKALRSFHGSTREDVKANFEGLLRKYAVKLDISLPEKCFDLDNGMQHINKCIHCGEYFVSTSPAIEYCPKGGCIGTGEEERRQRGYSEVTVRLQDQGFIVHEPTELEQRQRGICPVPNTVMVVEKGGRRELIRVYAARDKGGNTRWQWGGERTITSDIANFDSGIFVSVSDDPEKPIAAYVLSQEMVYEHAKESKDGVFHLNEKDIPLSTRLR